MPDWCEETDKRINYTKLCRLLVDGGTQALHGVFDGIHPPPSLKTDLNTNRTTLERLRRRGILNNEQWDKLYPPSGNNPKSEDFDITLLFVLLRNICGLTSPATGWDDLPPITDTSQEANLARVKYYRNNTIAHKPSTEIDDTDYKQYWQDISSALVSLGLSREDIDVLKSARLGEKDYNQLLDDWYISDKDIKTQLEDVNSTTAAIKSDAAVIKSDTAAIKSDAADLKSDAADLKSDAADLKSDTADLKSDTADLKSDTADLKSDTADLKSDAAAIKSDAAAIKSDAAAIKSDTADLKSDTADLKSDTAAIKSDTADLRSEAQCIKKKVHDLHTFVQSHSKEYSVDQLPTDKFSSLIESLCGSFHPNTRQWILEKVKSHVYSDQPESRVMLITAGPGMGKSTIAAKICQTYKDLGCLGGCHFFQFSNSTRNNPRLMLQSIARQMCDTVPGYGEALERKLQTNFGSKISELKCEELFTVLFEELLHRLEVVDDEYRRVIVLDAIDECCSEFLSEIQRVLDNKLSLLPSWLRFIVTSRPTTQLTSKEKLNIDPEDPQNKLDLKNFFESKLKELYGSDVHDLSASVEKLAQTSKGLFLVAFFVVDYLKNENVASISKVHDLFPDGISSVYEKYFSHLKEVILPYISDEQKFLEMLEAVVASKHYPIEKGLFYRILGLKSGRDVREVPGVGIKSRTRALELLHSLFPVENDHVSAFHKSVVDWLNLEGEKEHDFSVRVEDGNEGLYNPEHHPGGNWNEDLNASDTKVKQEFSVRVENGQRVLANQCYEVLSDIRNGKKDLDKPLDLTDTEKYVLEYGFKTMMESSVLSDDTKIELLINCFVRSAFESCGYSFHYALSVINLKQYEILPFGKYGVSKEFFDRYSFSLTRFDLSYHKEVCPFKNRLKFNQYVGVYLQAALALGANKDKLTPKPMEFFQKFGLPFLSGNHIANIPRYSLHSLSFHSQFSVIDIVPYPISTVVLPCKDGMMVGHYCIPRQTLVEKYKKDGTCSVKKYFPGLKRICMSPDQRFIVATELDTKGKVEIIDATTLNLVSSYQSPNVVRSCHVFGDRPWYVVARCYNNKIYVLEGETGRLQTTIDVDQEEDVEAVSATGHIALSKTWAGLTVRNNTLFTDDDGNFLEEMIFDREDGLIRRETHVIYRRLFLLSCVKPHERVSIYPHREVICPCRETTRPSPRSVYGDQVIDFSQDGDLLGYRYRESIFVVKSQDGSLFKRVYIGERFGSYGVVNDILYLSETDIIVVQDHYIVTRDMATSHIKYVLYLPGETLDRELFVAPRQQEEPLTILVKIRIYKTDIDRIFQYVFNNLLLQS